MGNRLRTALKYGGRICLSVTAEAQGAIRFEVTEDWAKLTRIGRAKLTRDELDAAEDTDRLIHDTAMRLIGDHINREAREMPPLTFPVDIG